MREYPGRLHHNTPAWVGDGALFHVRVRAMPEHPSLIESPLASDLLRAARRYHELGHWWCELFLLMPDHAHALLVFPREPGMSAAMRHWKRGTARFQRVIWQEGFFDHRLRSPAEAGEKWHYVRRNPVVKNLCTTEDGWPWWWSGIIENPLLAGGAR
ncbi:MAG: hypothetical protein HZA93_03430 [Verrucomicrobia bacterium]|nr:hypothetical protein [Verrucomicrobiota bacterium]